MAEKKSSSDSKKKDGSSDEESDSPNVLSKFVQGIYTKEKCTFCQKRVYFQERIIQDENIYHATCFRCSICQKTLRLDNFYVLNEELYCKVHYNDDIVTAKGSVKRRDTLSSSKKVLNTSQSSPPVMKKLTTATKTPDSVPPVSPRSKKFATMKSSLSKSMRSKKKSYSSTSSTNIGEEDDSFKSSSSPGLLHKDKADVTENENDDGKPISQSISKRNVTEAVARFEEIKDDPLRSVESPSIALLKKEDSQERRFSAMPPTGPVLDGSPTFRKSASDLCLDGHEENENVESVVEDIKDEAVITDYQSFWEEILSTERNIYEVAEKCPFNLLLEQVLTGIQNAKGAGESVEKNSLCANFFFVHEWYISAEDLLRKLIYEVWNVPKPINASKTTLNPSFVDETVCFTLQYWMENYPSDWVPNCPKGLVDIWSVFVKELDESGRLTENIEMVESFRQPEVKSFEVLELLTRRLAEQLTLVMHDAFSKIKISEFKSQGWMPGKDSGDCPNINRYIKLNTSITEWAISSIIIPESAKQRAVVYDKLIALCYDMMVIGNFDTAFAIQNAIAHPCVTRLKKTCQKLQEKSVERLKKINDFCDSNNNYGAYRQTLKSRENSEYTMPWVALYLKDVVFSEEVQPTGKPNSLLVDKVSSLSVIFKDFFRQQKLKPSWAANSDIAALVSCMLELTMSFDDLYDLSEKREPRGAHNTEKIPIQQVEISQLGSNTKIFLAYDKQEQCEILKNIEKTVDLIFAKCDLDNNNSISRDEFKRAVDQFPALSMEGFDDIDVDGDGELCREEIANVFRKIQGVPNSLDIEVIWKTFVRVKIKMSDENTFCVLLSSPGGSAIKYSIKLGYVDFTKTFEKLCKSSLTLTARHVQPRPHFYQRYAAKSKNYNDMKREQFLTNLFADACNHTENWPLLVKHGLIPKHFLFQNNYGSQMKLERRRRPSLFNKSPNGSPASSPTSSTSLISKSSIVMPTTSLQVASVDKLGGSSPLSPKTSLKSTSSHQGPLSPLSSHSNILN